METKIFEIISSQSSIEWIGRKVTGAHDGTIDIKSGTLTLNNGELSFGKFIIDTTSIKNLDMDDPDLHSKLLHHLAADDFFASDKYPTSTFEITSATSADTKNYHIEGKLTIKGITHPISFNAIINVNQAELTANGKITIDRTKFNMKFRSGSFFKDLADTLIYNDFDLIVNITAKPI